MSGVARKRLTVVDGGTPPGGGSPVDEDWRAGLTTNREGRIESTLHNLLLILENDEHFAGVFWLNESSNQVLLSRDPPWTGGSRDEFTDTDAYELAAWLQRPDRYQMLVTDEMALKAVIAVSRRHRRHPIREYLQALEWDGTPRVERMFIDMMAAEDSVYHQQAAKCFMVGAVARVLWFDPKNPTQGAKVDFMAVLEDKQGRKKTTAFETLFGAAWFVETMESPSHNDFYQILKGCWGVEIAEMHSFGKADVARVKGAITRRVDKYRAPYERAPRSWRRECVFVGTTNEAQWLRDPTGGRRFLPIALTRAADVDIAAIHANRDQLWAEAVHLFNEGFEFWVLPDEAGEQQEQRFMEDSWEGRIARWLTGHMTAKSADAEPPYPSRLRWGGRVAWTTTDELLTYAIGLDPGKHGRPEQMRISDVMTRLGWANRRRIWPDSDGVRERRWIREDGDAPSASGSKGGEDDCPF